MIETTLLQYIREEIEAGTSVFPLTKLKEEVTDAYKQHGIRKTVHSTRIKNSIREVSTYASKESFRLTGFYNVCTSVKSIITDAAMTPDEEEKTLLLAASILRKSVRHFPET